MLHRVDELKAEDMMNRKRDALTGNLREISLSDVIQLVALGGRSGALRLESERARGVLWFDSGRIVRATMGARSGEQAFYAAMTLTEGTFSVAFDVVCPGVNVDAEAYGLLMEGARRIDECNRVRAELGTGNYVRVDAAFAEIDPVDTAVAHLFAAPCPIDIAVSGCAFGELEMLTAIARLVQSGVLAPAAVCRAA